MTPLVKILHPVRWYKQRAKIVHPGRRLYRAWFWRGRTLTEAEDALSHDYWNKFVREPDEVGGWWLY